VAQLTQNYAKMFYFWAEHVGGAENGAKGPKTDFIGAERWAGKICRSKSAPP